MPTIIVGSIFFSIIALAAYKSRQSIKNNSCPGCSGSCSIKEKQNCSRSN
ncbi:MAG TPA: FeoB-associated Cys-rich membrane protein [Clostridiales bacterium]|nr:FeoB-associated Cys-rich membrane protein [Clostridiales bacterium]